MAGCRPIPPNTMSPSGSSARHSRWVAYRDCRDPDREIHPALAQGSEGWGSDMPKIMKGTALVSVALVLSGCGAVLQSEVGRMSYSTAPNIAGGLEDGGFACGPFDGEQGPPGLTSSMAAGPVSSGTCQHTGILISISVFSSAEVMKSFGVESCYVEGDSWIISPSDSAQATCAEIHAVVGGEVK